MARAVTHPWQPHAARLLLFERRMTRRQIAAHLGVCPTTVTRWLAGLPQTAACVARKGTGRPVRVGDDIGRVYVAPLREAFLRSGRTQGQVAQEMGWAHVTVGTTLGLRPVATTKRGKRYESWRSTVTVEVAERLARAIGVDPHEVGL